MVEKKAEEKEKQTISKSEVGSLSEVLDQEEAPKATITKTLPELISGFVKRVMENPASLNDCGRELNVWHDAQSVENRQQLVRDTRKAIETSKLTTEWLFSQYQMISQKDA